MAQVNIRLDDKLKEEADTLFHELGLSMTTAFNLFLRQVVIRRGIPFEITVDPFYSPNNMHVLEQSIQDAEAGKLIVHELIES